MVRKKLNDTFLENTWFRILLPIVLIPAIVWLTNVITTTAEVDNHIIDAKKEKPSFHLSQKDKISIDKIGGLQELNKNVDINTLSISEMRGDIRVIKAKQDMTLNAVEEQKKDMNEIKNLLIQMKSGG